MGIAVADSPSRTSTWAGWFGRGVGLGLVGLLLLWLAHLQLEHAQLVGGSTFRIQWGEIAIVQFLYILFGAVFTSIVLVARREPTKRSGLLVGGILPPLVPLLIFWDWAGPSIMPTRFRWIMDFTIQFPAAMAVGVMVTALLWQSVTNRQPIS